MIKYFYVSILVILLSSCSGMLYLDSNPQPGVTYTTYPIQWHTVNYISPYRLQGVYYHYKQPYVKKHNCYSIKSYNYNNKNGNSFYGHRKDY